MEPSLDEIRHVVLPGLAARTRSFRAAAPRVRKGGAAYLEDSCSLGSGDQVRQGNAVNAPDPTREMALVGKACAQRDIGQAGSDMTNKLDRSLPSQRARR